MNSMSQQDLRHSQSVSMLSAEDEEKRKRRLARNRESARECRRRKKIKQMSLKQQIAHLESENLQLRLNLQVESENGKYIQQTSYIRGKLESMMNAGASDASIMKEISEFQERFSDYGRDRRSAIDFHIAQLRRCLQPTQTTQTFLWLMCSAADFIKANSCVDPPPNVPAEVTALWRSLFDTLKPSQVQLDQFTALVNSSTLEDLQTASNNSNVLVNRLEDLVSDKNESLDQQMAVIQRIMSATQIAKFILWIDENPACMQMLEALWPHMTKEREALKKQQKSLSEDETTPVDT